MSLANFVPEIWSRMLNISLRKRLVGLNVVNQNYSGEIQNAGDKVRINRPAAVTVGTYTPNSDITIQTPTSTQVELDIDQFKYVALQVDDVYGVQSNVGLLQAYTDEASYHTQRVVDAFILSQYTEADSSNVIERVVLSASNIFGKIAEAAENLSNNDVPDEGRFLVLSPTEIRYLGTSSEFTAASVLGDTTKGRGFKGKCMGFDVYESTNLTTATDASSFSIRHCIYGHPSAVTFAMQHAQVENARMEKRFAWLVKGLLLYGAAAVKPEALGDLRSNLGAV